MEIWRLVVECGCVVALDFVDMTGLTINSLYVLYIGPCIVVVFEE